jgi:hypothetical protein
MKKKEIYTYEAPFTVFGLAASQRTSPEHAFRFAVGSFIEEYSNKVQVRCARRATDPPRKPSACYTGFVGCNIIAPALNF